ncbi:SDR family NAD(P)-dependent oxidoreductase, partial [Trichloromonas sp.]|uniref:SDR family NAD(P)-dependent oxidoreductase n=1 Tax=Trichloromonas sp. TaxID=3069249 RepID=UPI003D819342
GIDSIKRVEILSALQERLPEAPAVRPDDLGALQTLGQIVSHLCSGMTAAAPAAALTANAAAQSGLDSGRVATILLEVIADKTGYPVDMLELEMSLDSDLGIDSIKRVEILSALQERLPEAPAVKPDELGTLQTLGQIVNHLCAGKTAAAPASTAQVERIDRDTVSRTLLAVIADKTGYPVEMLELDMALDSDLGIDSIKRVEILSALQEQLPGAPAIRPEHLGTLQTVAQIVDFLASVSGAASPATAKETAGSETTAGGGIERKLVKVVPLKAKGDRQRLALADGASIWLTADGSELSRAVDARLKQLGYQPKLVSLDELDFLPAPSDLGGLILLSPASATDDLFLKRAFRLLQIAGPGLKKAGEQGKSLLATVSRLNGVFGLLPGASPADPVSGGLAGLSKTASHEWPQVSCKAIDLAPELQDATTTAAALVEEILTDGPLEVGISAAGQHTLKLTTVPLTGEMRELPVAAGDLLVISGGARGVTAEVAVSLAAASQATLLLLGRSPAPEAEPDWLSGMQTEVDIKKALLSQAAAPLKPKDLEQQYQAILGSREIRSNLQRIVAAGGKAIYRSVDLRDPAAVARTVAKVRSSYGPVKGLIHGAGVLADRLITDKTADQFELVYSTKIDGLRTLLDAVSEDDLRFMVLFSSSTGRFGRTGQVDYAVANEVLNKIAQQQARLRPKCRVVSLNWGPWDGGMVTPALKKLFAQEGVEVIGLQAGADYLLSEISTPPGGPVELVILGSRAEAQIDSQVQPPANIYISKAFDLDLSVAQYPFLASHVMDKKAVLPMAMIIEWMGHGAIHNNPGLRFHGFNDLRILKGVTLGPDETCSLQVMTGKALKADGFHVVPVELSGRNGDGQMFVHARAKMVLATRLPEAKPAADALDLAPYPRSMDAIYTPDRLFHGPDFHGIRQVDGCSGDGVVAQAKPAPLPSQWITQPLRNSWLSDPLALDSSFQMMILWSFERFDAASLPVFAGRYRQYADRFPAGGSEIRIHVTRQSKSKASADIDFVDPASGQLIARIEDYECIIDASLIKSFQRNKLQGAA